MYTYDKKLTNKLLQYKKDIIKYLNFKNDEISQYNRTYYINLIK